MCSNTGNMGLCICMVRRYMYHGRQNNRAERCVDIELWWEMGARESGGAYRRRCKWGGVATRVNGILVRGRIIGWNRIIIFSFLQVVQRANLIHPLFLHRLNHSNPVHAMVYSIFSLFEEPSQPRAASSHSTDPVC